MLRAEGLGKVYPAKPHPIEAVGNVSLDVADGESVAICGPSGSGKSTVLAMLAGLARPTRGRVTIADTDLYAIAAGKRADFCRRSLGVVFQFSGLLPTLRAIDNVAFPALVGRHGDPYPAAAELLKQVGLGDRLEAYPAELSGGQQRRVAVARALVNAPSIVLADEPTADLDPESAAAVTALLFDQRRRHGSSLIVVTHDPALAARADRTIWLTGGRITRETAGSGSNHPPLPEEPGSAALPSSRLGSDFRGTIERFAVALAAGIGLVAAVDTGVSKVQRNGQERVETARRELESTALRKLRFDIERIRPGAEGNFILTTYLDPLADGPRYVTTPNLRAFVQVGRDWVEIPCEPTDRAAGGFKELTGRSTFDFRFRPKVEGFSQLIPGYLHVRFSSSMLIGRNPMGTGGLYERTDELYVYLKPAGADDDAIRRLNHWDTVPLWIGMPPH